MLDPDRRKLLDSILRKIQNACRRTAGGDENAITAFIARFFQRVLNTISVESRRGSRAASVELPTFSTETQPTEFNFFSSFDTTLNDQVRILVLGQ
jgi:predicted component of type VI protein secretion system